MGDNSSQATIRPKRQFVPNSKKRQFVPNCLIDQLFTNLLKVEMKEIIKPTTNEFIQPRENNYKMLHFNVVVVEC